MSNYPNEPINPEDLGLLLTLAQPLYAESKAIESMTGDNPVLNGSWDDGSSKIKRGLEQMQRLVQVPRPAFVAPPVAPQPEPPQYIPIPQPSAPQAPTIPDDQLEFNFSKSQQVITNEWLEKISRQLTKLISLLESSKKNDAIKLKIDNTDKRV